MILPLIASIIHIFSRLTDWFGNQQLIDAGKAEADAAALRADNERLGKATAARADADQHNAGPGLRDDDGFKRD